MEFVMKNLALFVSIPLAIVGIVLAAITSMYIFENRGSEFANFEELESAGLIARGWLPAYFPKSATEIHEGHNIDNNRVWATFKYEKSDVKSIEEVCQRIAESDAGLKFLCPPFDSRTSTIVLRHDGEAYYNSFESPISYYTPLPVRQKI